MRILTLALLSMAFVCIQTGVVLAAKNPDTGPGCGLGTLAWADYKHPKNIAPQVMMATTNGTCHSKHCRHQLRSFGVHK